MKKVLMAVMILALASSAFAVTVVGSKHDLRATGGGAPVGTGLLEVCVVCHTPHQGPANPPNAQKPLWNHTLSAAGPYTAYTSTTMKVTPANVPVAAAGSATATQLCLSCHDGTVSVLSMYRTPRNGGNPTVNVTGNVNAGGMLTAAAQVGAGNSLATDHPVNFGYQAAITAGDTALVATASLPATVPLFAGNVECASCHQVHDPQFVPFLRMNNNASALCVACHIK